MAVAGEANFADVDIEMEIGDCDGDCTGLGMMPRRIIAALSATRLRSDKKQVQTRIVETNEVTMVELVGMAKKHMQKHHHN